MVEILTMEWEVAKKPRPASLGPLTRRKVIVRLAADHSVQLICRATGSPGSSGYRDAGPSANAGGFGVASIGWPPACLPIAIAG
jgi:hypothetical protein